MYVRTYERRLTHDSYYISIRVCVFILATELRKRRVCVCVCVFCKGENKKVRNGGAGRRTRVFMDCVRIYYIHSRATRTSFVRIIKSPIDATCVYARSVREYTHATRRREIIVINEHRLVGRPVGQSRTIFYK